MTLAQSLTYLAETGETDIEISGTEIVYSSLTFPPGTRISGSRNAIGGSTSQIIIKRGGSLIITPPFEMRDLTLQVEADVRISSVISVVAPAEVEADQFFETYRNAGVLSPLEPTFPYLVHWNKAKDHLVSFHDVTIYSASPWGEIETGVVAFISAFAVERPICFAFNNCSYSGKSIFLFLGHPGLGYQNTWMPSTIYMRRCDISWTPDASEPIDPNAPIVCYKPCYLHLENSRINSVDLPEPGERQIQSANFHFSTAVALAQLQEQLPYQVVADGGHMATNTQVYNSALSLRCPYAEQPNAHITIEGSASGCLLNALFDNPNEFAIGSLVWNPGQVNLQPTVEGGGYKLTRYFEFGIPE